MRTLNFDANPDLVFTKNFLEFGCKMDLKLPLMEQVKWALGIIFRKINCIFFQYLHHLCKCEVNYSILMIFPGVGRRRQKAHRYLAVHTKKPISASRSAFGKWAADVPEAPIPIHAQWRPFGQHSLFGEECFIILVSEEYELSFLIRLEQIYLRPGTELWKVSVLKFELCVNCFCYR
jgi:hypothetical protein